MIIHPPGLKQNSNVIIVQIGFKYFGGTIGFAINIKSNIKQ